MNNHSDYVLNTTSAISRKGNRDTRVKRSDRKHTSYGMRDKRDKQVRLLKQNQRQFPTLPSEEIERPIRNPKHLARIARKEHQQIRDEKFSSDFSGYDNCETVDFDEFVCQHNGLDLYDWYANIIQATSHVRDDYFDDFDDYPDESEDSENLKDDDFLEQTTRPSFIHALNFWDYCDE